MRVLIVKLSSLGDVVHALPVVHDIRGAFPGAVIDWVVEPGFAPLLCRVEGLNTVIECALRRWRKAWWTGAVRTEWSVFKAQLQAQRYDAVLDLQGLTKSALIARLARLTPAGASHGLANRTEGSSYEPPARWLVDHPIRIEPRTHVVDRSRLLAAEALRYALDGPPRFGLRAEVPAPAPAPGGAPTLVLVHGSSRDDKLWPEAAWIALGQRAIAQGWRIALPHASALELARAQRIAAALIGGGDNDNGDGDGDGDGDHDHDHDRDRDRDHDHDRKAASVWPAMGLDALVDRLGASQGVIGVDSGLSHIAVALDLPHVQIYNWPTAWRTGPQQAHGTGHQVAVESQPTPTLDAVWSAWELVRKAVH